MQVWLGDMDDIVCLYQQPGHFTAQGFAVLADGVQFR